MHTNLYKIILNDDNNNMIKNYNNKEKQSRDACDFHSRFKFH